MDSIKNQKPSYNWRARASETEGLLTVGRITATDKILDTFMDNLSKSKDNTDVWKSIEKVVKALNKLNKDEEYFIENDEREELIYYIQNEAEKAGLKFAGDVTDEWRDEW
jgi:hypothetical protein